MKIKSFILFLLLFCFCGCTENTSVATAELTGKTVAVIADNIEAARMSLYSATASQRNAVQQEVANVLPASYSRILTERNRANIHHTVHFASLISTRTPNCFKLSRKSITHLVAFPKDCHVIRLRRLLI